MGGVPFRWRALGPTAYAAGLSTLARRACSSLNWTCRVCLPEVSL
jgi:hypothetical protein